MGFESESLAGCSELRRSRFAQRLDPLGQDQREGPQLALEPERGLDVGLGRRAQSPSRSLGGRDLGVYGLQLSLDFSRRLSPSLGLRLRRSPRLEDRP